MSNTTMSWLGGGAPAGTGTVPAHDRNGRSSAGSGVAGGLAGWVAWGDGRSVWAVPAERWQRGNGRSGCCVSAGSAGVRTAGDDAALVWDWSAALVPVLASRRRRLGSGHPGRGPGLHQLAAGDWQAGPGGDFPGGINSVTGKPVPGVKYAPATVAHCETVLRS